MAKNFFGQRFSCQRELVAVGQGLARSLDARYTHKLQKLHSFIIVLLRGFDLSSNLCSIRQVLLECH